ncbi:STAS domain-containing protein [Jidongwangia harbinensis]|uniref:STAS domain-containing protein n=1 Tax=Jidongwangia harbinensis TaxID=2878561 RepID=UPI001CD9773A|nr:STAS domain-containing protein [Jidongwangia harbinensis]MCA2216578.1 STAS domain-containing protein [Jidongwangia harbinensis]
MARFAAKTSADRDTAVVTLVGDCDLSGRDELTMALLGAVEQANVVVVDMAALTFLDSSGVHGLVTAHHAAVRAGRRLHVVNAVGTVARVLDLTGVGELLGAPDHGGDHRG